VAPFWIQRKLLVNKAFQIWKNKPEMSMIFWLFTALGYLAGILAVTSIFLTDYSYLQASGSVGERATFHLRIVRLTFITMIMLVFPVLLFTSLRRLFYFLVGVTAWMVILYVDDALVLYKIMEYPPSEVVSVVFALRPFVMMGLLWMCFEIKLRLNNGS
jgi:hypothetical protein